MARYNSNMQQKYNINSSRNLKSINVTAFIKHTKIYVILKRALIM